MYNALTEFLLITNNHFSEIARCFVIFNDFPFKVSYVQNDGIFPKVIAIMFRK